MNVSRMPKPAKNGVSVRGKTYESLKSAIFSGRFRPGERLAEEHLAEELGVSHIVIPYSAAVHCAFGLTTSDIVHENQEIGRAHV